ncbi:MAG: hypothetical protein WC612_01745 [Bdellovibrionales bacterium]|jgi:hypothetical protein
MTKMVSLEAAADAAPTIIVHLTSQEWLAPVLALHAQARSELPDDKKHMLLPRPAAYFEELLTKETGAVFGAVQGEQLVGMVAVVRSTNWLMAHQAKHVTCPDKGGSVRRASGFSAVAVVQSLCVLKRGNGIAIDLIAATKGWAAQKGCSFLFAQVAQDNACGQKKFKQNNFCSAAEWTEVSGGGEHAKILMRYRLSAADF